MGIKLGAATAMGDLAEYTGSSLMAGANFDYRIKPYFTIGLDFHYMGFALDTSRLDFASTLLPFQLYGHLRLPLADNFYPYAGLGGGILFVRYGFSHAISVKQSYFNISPRLGLQYEVDEELTLDLAFLYQQTFDKLGESGDGLELGLSDYRYWAFSLGLSYAISGNN